MQYFTQKYFQENRIKLKNKAATVKQQFMPTPMK
jgi:hypothetical protein